MFSAVLLAALLGSAGVTFAALEAETFIQQLQQLESKGSNVVTFRSASLNTTVTITRASCEALAQDDGVQRAGLLLEGGTRDIPELGARISVYAASSSLFPGLRSADGIVGATMNESSQPRRIAFEGTRPLELAAGPMQPEGLPTNTGVVFPLSSATTTADTCVVVLDRFSSPNDLARSLGAELVVSGGDVVPARQLAPSSDPVAQWRSRPAQYFSPALGAIGGLCMSLLIWTRSGEMAAYRLSGTRRPALATMLTFETLLAASVFATSGTLGTCLLVGAYLSPTETLLWTLAGSASWILASAGGVIRSVTVGAAALTRER
ncbi:hypothetical protein [Curtobacterium sp. 24E2]|nr:hypothetical protein JN350_18510 [Curtobacterium sp. 24E2]